MVKPSPEVFERFCRAIYEWTSSGLPLRPKPLHDSIVAACQACEFRDGNICSKCGCFYFVKAKLATESCPEGKWLATAEAPVKMRGAKVDMYAPSSQGCCGKLDT